MTSAAAAREAFLYFRPLVRLPIHWQALLGNIDGEIGFKLGDVGDHGEAFGFGQWHEVRANAILKGCGVDVKTAGATEQCRALFWEMNHGDGYRHVWANLLATETIVDGVTVLVTQFEHSAKQARDIDLRATYAKKWALLFMNEA